MVKTTRDDDKREKTKFLDGGEVGGGGGVVKAVAFAGIFDQVEIEVFNKRCDLFYL